MPRITAPSVAEHHARQRRRILTAAVDLFIERGYDRVSLADIATQVGLARNSLYRYFASKADILVVWFHDELERHVATSAATMADDGDPVQRITAWVDDQLDYAGRPEHALAVIIPRIEPELAPDIRAELAAGRERLSGPLREAIAEAGSPDEATARATAELISGLVLAAANHERVTRTPNRVLRERLYRAITALVEPV